MIFNTRTYKYYFKIIVIPMLIFFGLAYLAWQWNINKIKDNQERQVSEIIHNVIQVQAKRDLLLPKIVFINADSSKKKELNEKIIEQISKTLTKKYLADDTTKFSDLELKPYFVLTNKPNKDGSYTLTEEQLNDLKEHLDFLTKQIDVEFDKSKAEVGNEINNLNTWVTIWIGVIGFLGIFIPVLINIDVAKNIDRAEKKSEIAFKQAKASISNAQILKKETDKIPDIQQKVSEASATLKDIQNKANEANQKASNAEKEVKEAKKQSDSLHLVYAIDKLDKLELKNYNELIDKTKWIPLCKKTLLSIKENLEKCKIQHDGEIIKENLREFVRQFQRISFQKIVSNENTEMINEYLSKVTDILKVENYNQDNFEKIISGLGTLADNLKNDIKND